MIHYNCVQSRPDVHIIVVADWLEVTQPVAYSLFMTTMTHAKEETWYKAQGMVSILYSGIYPGVRAKCVKNARNCRIYIIIGARLRNRQG